MAAAHLHPSCVIAWRSGNAQVGPLGTTEALENWVGQAVLSSQTFCPPDPGAPWAPSLSSHMGCQQCSALSQSSLASLSHGMSSNGPSIPWTSKHPTGNQPAPTCSSVAPVRDPQESFLSIYVEESYWGGVAVTAEVTAPSHTVLRQADSWPSASTGFSPQISMGQGWYTGGLAGDR